MMEGCGWLDCQELYIFLYFFDRIKTQIVATLIRLLFVSKTSQKNLFLKKYIFLEVVKKKSV